MDLELHRDYRDAGCTLGVIEAFGRRLQTMERAWVPTVESVAGTKGVSCIAPGRYKLERHNSENHPNVWALVNKALDVYHFEHEVPRERKGKARTAVLIHPANWAEELRGCIAPGKERMRQGQVWCVQRSRDAINELRNIMQGKLDVWLVITEERLN